MTKQGGNDIVIGERFIYCISPKTNIQEVVKLKRRMISVTLALCLLISAPLAALAEEEAALPEEGITVSMGEGVILPSEEDQPPEEGTVPSEEIQPSEEGTAPSEEIQPSEEGTAPSEEIQPSEEGTVPSEEDLLPEEGAAPPEEIQPSEEGTASSEEIQPSEEGAAPPEEGTAPSEETLPSEEGTAPPEEDLLPEEGTAPSEETLPSEEGTAPPEEGTAPSEGAALQQSEVPLQSRGISEKESISMQADSADNVVPTPTQVYEAMIALKDQDAYKEGTTWTDYEPYSNPGYSWKGGLIDGANISAVGCVAFAFILSDEAFGSLPNRMYAPGGFAFEDIKVGDILRVSNDAHTVIVLEVNEAGVVIAEGNNNGKVHWGRTISREEVMSNTSHYITRYPEGYVAPDDPTANDVIDKGTLGTGLAWSLTKAGTLTISGSGAMPDFSSNSEQPWNPYSSEIRTVVFEEGVTSIGACAFWMCGVLGVKIPTSVTAIGNSAFRQSSIISVDIPSGVKTIGDDAFRECENLSSATVAEGVETIGERAFQSCIGLVSVALPASIGDVGAAAFFQCTKLKTATFAPGIQQVKLGDNLFTQCYDLMSVTLPQSIDRIGEGMFQNCLMLPGVEIPQGAESIGNSAFASSGVSVVLIPDSVISIGSAAFSATQLSVIYYTGTEEQWKGISKIGDTAATVAKVTIHYEYKPTATPTPTPTTEPSPSPTPTTEPSPSPAPTTGPSPSTAPTTEPGQPPVPTTAPGQTSVPTTEPGQSPAPTSVPDTMVPSIRGESGKEGWEVIKEEAANAFEGKWVNVDMNGASIVPGDVLDHVKGQNVTISFDMGNGVTWCVNGRSVTAEHAGDVDLSVQVGMSAIPENIVNQTAGERPTTQLSLAHSGDFGYSAVLMIYVGSANAGMHANLFYYNENDGRLEFVTADQIDADGIAELTFTHASDYIIVVGDTVMDGSSGESGGSSGSGDGAGSVNHSSSKKTEVQSPRTGEVDTVIGGDNAGEFGQEGSRLNLLRLLLMGVAGMAAAGVIICLIQKKVNRKD